MSATPGARDTAFRELIRTFGLLERLMQPYFVRFGISGAQWGVLRNLHRSESAGEAALRLTELSRRLLVRPPSVTGLVDRLERLGLVRRRAAEDDLRAKHVALTDDGRRLVERVLTGHGDQIALLMDGLTPAQQLHLGRLLAKLGNHLAGLADASPAENEPSESE
jgi:DNA-binding MarR family transcriptional regulator